jgi:hypothetical protein
MSANQARIELLIDVFDQAAQRALAVPTLLPAELVAAVIEEFREIEVLGSDPARYQLIKAATRTALDEQVRLGQQLAAGDRLALAERQEPLPPGTQPPSRHIYLRDQGSGTVYKLSWQPAVIGRADVAQKDSQQLAVNLGAHSAGQRVSRRHAQIVETKGQFFLEQLAQNPTTVKRKDGTATRVERDRCRIQHGDTCVLENSQIVLKVIVRDKEPAT